MTTPSDLAIVLAAMPGRHAQREGWSCADEVRGRLGLLGFDVTTQQVASWFRRLASESLPAIETRSQPWSRITEYRVTTYGATLMANHLPSIRPQTPWTPIEELARA